LVLQGTGCIYRKGIGGHRKFIIRTHIIVYEKSHLNFWGVYAHASHKDIIDWVCFFGCFVYFFASDVRGRKASTKLHTVAIDGNDTA
jgi:hypothetical protein